MRAVALTFAIACTALVTACSTPVQRMDGLAEPAGSPGPAGSAPATPVSSTSAVPSAVVLGPAGLGGLTLGMTREQAAATGLVAPFTQQNGPGESCAWVSHLRDAPAAIGSVHHSNAMGIAAIEAYGDIATPQGIKVGSKLADVRRAYPKWSDLSGSGAADGRGPVPVPGNGKAVYRIALEDGAVVELTLQFADQDCYE
jgi:hypothetical protein